MIFKPSKSRLSRLALGLIAFSALYPASGFLPGAKTSVASAQTGKTGLPLPRYVSLKSTRVNVRVGPGRKYNVEWLFTRKGLPVEIIQEYDNWRKIRDAEGSEGWVLHSLLSGSRTAIVSPWDQGQERLLEMQTSPEEGSRITAKLQPGVVVDVKSCDENWCRVSVQRRKGYLKKSLLWGVYPDENFDD